MKQDTTSDNWPHWHPKAITIIDVQQNLTLAELLNKAKEAGFSEKDFNKLEFRLSSINCFHEDDDPDVILTEK